MSKDTPLARKIATLIAKDTFDGAALRLGSSGRPEAMTHVLQAIDDTMMLREAVFGVGDSAVTLRISGKRLLMLEAATDDLSAPDGLIHLPLSADTPDALMQVGTLLQTLISREGHLTLERRPAEASTKQSGSGVGIQSLSASWAPEALVQETDPMARFLQVCKPLALATVTVHDGEVEAWYGTQLEVEKLQRVYDENWAAIDGTYNSELQQKNEPILRILDAFGPEGEAFLVAIIEQNQCLGIVRMEDISQVAAMWVSSLSLR